MSKDGQKEKPEGYVFGRPTEYRKEMCQEAVDFLAEGYSKEALAGHLSISKDTLYEWVKKHKDFADAIKMGETKSQMKWEKYGHQGLWSDAKTPFSQSVWIFNMKNRFGWNDKKEVDLNVAPIKFKYDPEEK